MTNLKNKKIRILTDKEIDDVRFVKKVALDRLV
jgi:hypothetical protein